MTDKSEASSVPDLASTKKVSSEAKSRNADQPFSPGWPPTEGHREDESSGNESSGNESSGDESSDNGSLANK